MTIKENDFKSIKETYKEAFPKEERMPFFMFKILTRDKTSKLYSFYENGNFIGFAYCIYYKDLMYILFLAVNNKIRAKGYGSKILSEICKIYKNYRIILFSEELTKDCDNYEQRLRRVKFYEKNNFYISGVKICEVGVKYDILSYNRIKFSKDEYMELFKNYLGKIIFWSYKHMAE